MWQGLNETDAEIYAVVWETKVRSHRCKYLSQLLPCDERGRVALIYASELHVWSIAAFPACELDKESGQASSRENAHRDGLR
jgi:hypothetical protein